MDEYKSTGTFNIVGRGTVLTVNSIREINKDEETLINTIVKIDGLKYKILGVESYAVFKIFKGDPIGLLVEPVPAVPERIITTTLNNILSLISCAEDYGFERDVLFDAFRGMLDDTLTDEEIEVYARKVEAGEGFGEEDYEIIKERLIRFRDKYCEL